MPAGDVGGEVPADSLVQSSCGWSRLAAALSADIQEQPEMIKGGELRDYQMQVCTAVLHYQESVTSFSLLLSLCTLMI